MLNLNIIDQSICIDFREKSTKSAAKIHYPNLAKYKDMWINENAFDDLKTSQIYHMFE